VLVFLSGTDPHDVTGLAARAAATTGWAVDVVVGAAYPHLERLRAWAGGARDVTVHVDTREMPRLMAAAGIAVGAAGSASWERCAVGLPAVLIDLAENQVENARLLAEAGAAVALGDRASLSERDVAAALADLVGDPASVRAMSDAAARICDGRGVARVADELEALARQRS
jgi:UDP-2,4-diacetamido-2,4,6-trideoxy-beta-L-altropyranose hydrolase